MKLNWETTVVVVAVIAGVFGLQYLKLDSQNMVSLAGTILSAVLLSRASEIKTNVNGNLSSMVQAVTEIAKTLAANSNTPPAVAAQALTAATAAAAATAQAAGSADAANQDTGASS